MLDYLDKMGLYKKNYHGYYIPVAGGIFYYLFTLGFWFFLYPEADLPRLIYLGSMITAAGLLDDLYGDKSYQGFKGHFHQLLKGKLTTGNLKAIISFITVYLILPDKTSLTVLVVDILLILLITNFFNLLDVRPGRCLKFFLLTSLFIFFLHQSEIYYLLPMLSFTLIYLPFELKEKVMLGDSGANLIGVMTGYGFSQIDSFLIKLLILLTILSITLVSEKNSLSRYINDNKILKWYDGLGRVD